MNKVNFNLKNPNKESSLIILVFRYSNRIYKESMKITIPVKHWNKKRQRIREISGYFEYPGYNAKLDYMERTVKKAFSNFQRRDQIPSIKELKEEIYNILDINNLKNSKHDTNTIIGYIENFIHDAKENEKYTKGTLQGYNQMLKVVKSLPNSRTLEFKDLDNSILDSMTYIMVNKFDYGINQINKIQKKLITVVNHAKIDGYSINRAFYSKGWRVKAKSINNSGVAFTKEEIHKIKELKLNKRLDKIRDIFLLGINVGQRYSDLKSLNKDKIINKDGVEYWDFVQQKTKKRITIPVDEQSKNILNKYNGYPPYVSSQIFNKYLKEICKLAEINDEIIIRKEYPNKKTKEERKKKYEIVSSHDMRRTFVTLAHKKGIPAAVIMKVSGHSNLKTFSDYLKIDLKKEMLNLTNLY